MNVKPAVSYIIIIIIIIIITIFLWILLTRVKPMAKLIQDTEVLSQGLNWLTLTVIPDLILDARRNVGQIVIYRFLFVGFHSIHDLTLPHVPSTFI